MAMIYIAARYRDHRKRGGSVAKPSSRNRARVVEASFLFPLGESALRVHLNSDTPHLPP